MIPFNYPVEPHQRRHGPIGYVVPESFRPWLRDEFAFRCVYCLRREAWYPGRTSFEIDHLNPVSTFPELSLVYDNLVYSCDVCNSIRGSREIPDPSVKLLVGAVVVDVDGHIRGTSSDAKRIIRILGLDDAEFVAYRMRWIKIVALARMHDPSLFQQLMGFPTELPDLSSLRPPQGNTRPDGISVSYLRLRERGELAATY